MTYNTQPVPFKGSPETMALLRDAYAKIQSQLLGMGGKMANWSPTQQPQTLNYKGSSYNVQPLADIQQGNPLYASYNAGGLFNPGGRSLLSGQGGMNPNRWPFLR